MSQTTWNDNAESVLKHGLNPNGRGGNSLFADAKAKQAAIVAMRKDGHTFDEIAAHFNCSVTYVFKRFKGAMKEAITEDVQHIRKLELARLDELQNEVVNVMRTFHPLVQRGEVVRGPLMENGREVMDENGEPIWVVLEDQSVKLAAVQRALSIMERRAKLLGLDSPTKIAATDPTGQQEANLVQFYIPSNEATPEVPA